MKFFVALFALVFAVSVFAQVNDPNEQNAHKNLLDWDRGPSGFGDAGDFFGEDYSYDQCFTHYEVFVICPIECCCDAEKNNLGYINPDGVKNVMSNAISFRINGGSGWPFEFYLTLGQYQDFNGKGVWFPNQMYSKTYANGNPKDIYLTDVELRNDLNTYYDDMVGGKFYGRAKLSGHNALTSEVKGEYNANGDLIGAEGWALGSNCCDEYVKCNGYRVFTLIPGYLWAEPDAVEGLYSWDVLFEVDYLTFISSNGFPIAGDQGK